MPPRKDTQTRPWWRRLLDWLADPQGGLGKVRAAVWSLNVILKHFDACVAELALGYNPPHPTLVDADVDKEAS